MASVPVQGLETQQATDDFHLYLGQPGEASVHSAGRVRNAHRGKKDSMTPSKGI